MSGQQSITTSVQVVETKKLKTEVHIGIVTDVTMNGNDLLYHDGQPTSKKEEMTHVSIL